MTLQSLDRAEKLAYITFIYFNIIKGLAKANP
jgi:hypothetical protein